MIYSFRKIKNKIMLSLVYSSLLVVFLPLLLIFIYLIKNGQQALSFDFFFDLPRAIGEKGGGIKPALLGSFYMILLSGVFGIPLGVMTGVYLNEYKNGSKFTIKLIRFSVDLLNGVPSIVIGLFVYMVLVAPLKGFSALAGSISLAIVSIPIIVKSTEEALLQIPHDIRQAGLGLGLPRWKVIWFIIVKSARKNISRGLLLALARVSGETAPLLFTAFGNMYLSFHPLEPMASLPVQIYNYAISPYPEWQQLAWSGSLVLIVFVASLNILSKFIMHKFN